MATKTHYASFMEIEGEFLVKAKGTIIAQSSQILQLDEFHEDYEFNPVYYFPIKDVNMDFLKSNDNHTNCPIKGDATYWNVEVDDKILENAVWAYPKPLDDAAPLENHVAFDISKGVNLYRNNIRLIKQGFKGKRK